jgi:DNA repair protein RadD
MAGRAMRPAPGKVLAVILDHAGNCMRHGLPEWNQEWSLADRRKSRKGAPVRTCPECGLVIPLGQRVCPHCGEELRGWPEPPPVAAPGELVPPDAAELERHRVKAMRRWEQKRWAGADLRRLSLVAAIRGYKPGWALHEQRRALERRGDRL